MDLEGTQTFRPYWQGMNRGNRVWEKHMRQRGIQDRGDMTQVLRSKTAWQSQQGLDNGRVKYQVGSHMRLKTEQDQGPVMSDFVPQIDIGGWTEGKGATAATDRKLFQ